MKRVDFLRLFDPVFCDKSYNYTHDLDLETQSSNAEVLKALKKVFPVNFEEGQAHLFKVYPDWLFMEDNPEEEGWRYQVSVDLNDFYDNYPFDHQNTAMKSVLRLCNEKGQGIYALGLGYKFLNSGSSPHEDPELKMIFPSFFKEREYSKNWLFGFKDMEQAKKWLDNEKMIEEMHGFGLRLATLEVPENFVIEGHDQLIYRSDKVVSVEYSLLSSLSEEKPKSKIRRSM